MQSSSTSSPVGDPRQPILLNFLPRAKPGRELSTMNSPSERLPGSPVTAYTSARSATGPLVMKVLTPFRT